MPVSRFMTQLSVNINKVALLRNSRTNGVPSVLHAAELCVGAGAHGITVHPRPDARHIRPGDVNDLSDYLSDFPTVEFNVEGNPFPEFLELVRKVRPQQCTLVPDTVDALTSDHGWDLEVEGIRLAPVISQLHALGIRVSLFMDVQSTRWELAREFRLGEAPFRLGGHEGPLQLLPHPRDEARRLAAPRVELKRI